jgi:pimeloyl-ACP methyl ester carboxylesterase
MTLAAGPEVTSEARGRVGGDGVELSYGYWPGAGPALVALHGITASYRNFGGIAERIAGRRPVLALDLRGRGGSDKPDGPYGMDQHADDVAAAMRGFGIDSAVVIGHSMGAYVAAAVAARHPELVAGVGLIDGGYLLDPPPGVDVATLLDTLLAPQVARLRMTFPTREAYYDYWRALPTFAPEEWGPWVEAYLDYDLGGTAPDLRPRPSEPAVRFDFADMADRAAAEARLRAVRVPVLVVRAEHGIAAGQPPVLPDAVMEGIRSCVPGVEEHLVEGTTHYTVALADPGASRVADFVVDFTARCGV